jgi:hypothetical protein
VAIAVPVEYTPSVPADSDDPSDETQIQAALEGRFGRIYARQRVGIETAHEAQIFGQGLNFFHLENWYSAHAVIRLGLRLSGLYGRGRRNAADVQVRHNTISLPRLPRALDGFTLLQISDPHADISPDAVRRVTELLPSLRYDVTVLTGDYRGTTFGPYLPAIDGVGRVLSKLRGPVYGVLGNHDTIRMVPALEMMGVRMLVNECVTIERDAARLYLAGIDDAHFFRVDNIEKAGEPIPHDACSILLSHTPEVYRQAAAAGFDVMLSGHTHGGQLCLPGGIAIMKDSKLPRRFIAGAWRYHGMDGYTSVGLGCSIVAVRLNCPPEITLHHLRCTIA